MPIGYVPPPISAKILHVFLGYVNTNASVGLSGGFPLALTFPTSYGATFTPADVGCPVMIFSAGASSVPFWSTIQVFTDSNHVSIFPIADHVVSGVQAIIFRELKPSSATAPYVIKGSMQFDSSLSNRYTFNFDVHSPDHSFIPVVGMPVLVTQDAVPSLSLAAMDIFGGSIAQTKPVNYPGAPAPTPTKTTCQCESWDKTLARRLLMLTGAFPIGNTTDTIYGDGFGNELALTRYPMDIFSVTLELYPAYTPVVETYNLAPDFTQDWTWSLSWQFLLQNSGTVLGVNDRLIVNYNGAAASATTPYYSNMLAGDIVKALGGLLAAEGVSLGSIIDGPFVDILQLTTRDSIGSALSALCQYISSPGSVYQAIIDARRVLNFSQVGVTNAAPWNIDTTDGSDRNVLIQVGSTNTRDKFANAAFVETNVATSPSSVLQQFIGTGSTRDWNVNYPIGAAPTVRRVNRVPVMLVSPQTVGLDTPDGTATGFDWFYSPGSTQVRAGKAGGTWDAGHVYSDADVATLNTVDYTSLQGANTGHVPQFSAYAATYAYSYADQVEYSGYDYVSIYPGSNSNLNQQPDVSPSYWAVMDPWNPATTYTNSQACQTPVGYFYVSLQSGNLNNPPPIPPLTSAWWQVIPADAWWTPTVLGTNEYLLVNYSPEIAVAQVYISTAATAARAAVESGTGEYDTYQSITGTIPFVLLPGQNLAQAVALAFSALSQQPEIQTYRPGLLPAQSITVNLPEIGVSGSYVVNSVTMTDGDNMALWKVTLVAGAIIGDWKTAFKNTIGGGSASSGFGNSGSSSPSGFPPYDVPVDPGNAYPDLSKGMTQLVTATDDTNIFAAINAPVGITADWSLFCYQDSHGNWNFVFDPIAYPGMGQITSGPNTVAVLTFKSMGDGTHRCTGQQIIPI